MNGDFIILQNKYCLETDEDIQNIFIQIVIKIQFQVRYNYNNKIRTFLWYNPQITIRSLLTVW